MSRHLLSPLTTRATIPGQKAALDIYGEAVTNLVKRGEFPKVNFSLEKTVDEMNRTTSLWVFELPTEVDKRNKIRDSFKFIGFAKWGKEKMQSLYAKPAEKERMAEEIAVEKERMAAELAVEKARMAEEKERLVAEKDQLAVEKERMAEELAVEKERMAEEKERLVAEKDNLVAELVAENVSLDAENVSLDAENVSLVAENSRLEELLEKDQEMPDAPSSPMVAAAGVQGLDILPMLQSMRETLEKAIVAELAKPRPRP